MKTKLPAGIGLKLAAVWLILTGLTGLVDLHFAGLGLVLAGLAIVSGALILLQR